MADMIETYENYICGIDESVLSGSEMTKDQIVFLCDLIKKYNPHKILEVGVAAGSTTSIIINCLERLGIESKFFSVDLCERLYYQEDKKTGYLINEYIEAHSPKYTNHELLLGKFLPEWLDYIGKDIEFVILDTVHHLPGELLDFLAVLPYLSENAVVVLHDISLEHSNTINDRYSFATQVLFQTVKADKILCNENEYPNIAAFVVDHTTKKAIFDVFSSLTLSWYYYPSDNELKIYKDFYHRYYDEELCKIFDQAASLNYKSMHELDYLTTSYIASLSNSLLNRFEHILLYGGGLRGSCMSICLRNNPNIASKIEFVVSNKEDAIKLGCLVWGDIPYSINDTLIILSANSNELRTKLNQSDWIWIDVPDPIWSTLEIVYGSNC